MGLARDKSDNRNEGQQSQLDHDRSGAAQTRIGDDHMTG